jgi:hypothetical protein
MVSIFGLNLAWLVTVDFPLKNSIFLPDFKKTSKSHEKPQKFQNEPQKITKNLRSFKMNLKNHEKPQKFQI